MQSKGNNDNQNDKGEKVKATPKQSQKSNNEKSPSKKESKDDPLMEYISSSRAITQQEVNDAPLLIIDEDSPANLFNKTQVKINAAGLIGGRNEKDGVAIFGQVNAQNSDKFKADFELHIFLRFITKEIQRVII